QFLRSDDTELVLNAYLAYGSRFVTRLEGAFHLAILDQGSKELVIANDRFGLRPLYWSKYQGRFAFAPEVKALLADPDFEKQLNLTAVAEFMRFEHLLGEKTFFEGISLLPVASLLRYQLVDKSLTITPYWEFPQSLSLSPQTPYPEIVEETARLFQQAVEKLATDTHRVGLYLSGGLDSRLIGACLAKNRSGFPTVSYGSKDCIDVLLSERISSVIGGTHHYFEFTDGRWVRENAHLHLDLTEGHHSWVHSHGISTLGQVRSIMDVNLTGWGVHWGLGGNSWDPLLHDATDNWAFECYLFHLHTQKYTWPGLTEAEAHCLFTDEYQTRLQGLAFDSLRSQARKLRDYPMEQQAEYFFILHHNRRLTQNFVVFNSSHVENRFPGYDYELFDFINSIPATLRANRKLQQDVIEYVNPRLALIPRDRDGLLFTRKRSRRVPHHIFTRLKQRINRHLAPVFQFPSQYYADYEKWLRTDLRSWATDVLLDGRMANRGIFNMEFIKSLLMQLDRPFSGAETHTIGKVAPIMTFEMMLREYFD
ncbi:MAG: asparagine synthetase B, partial [Anaerolineales bacterium]